MEMILDVTPIAQTTSFSCVAAVYQMLAAYYNEEHIDANEAIARTGCNPDGADFEVVGPLLGYSSFPIRKNFKEIRKWIGQGHPVMTNDSVTYIDDHAILIIGKTPKGLYYVDPNHGQIFWKSDNWFRKASQEFYLVAKVEQRELVTQ